MLLREEGPGNHNSNGWRSKVLTPQVWCGRFTLRAVMLLRAEGPENHNSSDWRSKILTPAPSVVWEVHPEDGDATQGRRPKKLQE